MKICTRFTHLEAEHRPRADGEKVPQEDEAAEEGGQLQESGGLRVGRRHRPRRLRMHHPSTP